MRVYKIISLAGLILLFYVFSIETGIFSTGKRIPYSQIDNIEWISFKRLPDFFDNYSAEIYTSIYYRLENDSIDVESFMHPFKSYVIFPGLLPAIVLKHEKYHFKITELLSRKFESEVNHLKKPFDKRKIQEIYRKVCEDENLIQKVYDLDTKHGTDTLIQDNWFQVIDILITATDFLQSDYKTLSSMENSIILNRPTLAYLFKTISTDDSMRLQLTYFDNGNIRSEIIYKDEKPDGYYYKWNENGSLNQTILYKNGSREGLSVTFSFFGDTIETLNYRNNKIID